MRDSPAWIYARLIGAEWRRGVTGPTSAILFVVALGIGTAGVLGFKLPAEPITLPLSWAVAVAAGFRSAYRVWLAEHEARLKLEKRSLELGLISGRFVDGDNPNPDVPRYLVLMTIKNASGIPITDCTLKGKSSGQADVYALDICEPFSLRIDETAHKPVLSFEMATRHILLPTFSKKEPRWSLFGTVFHPPGPHQFTFSAFSSSAPGTHLTIVASFDTGDWVFSEA